MKQKTINTLNANDIDKNVEFTTKTLLANFIPTTDQTTMIETRIIGKLRAIFIDVQTQACMLILNNVDTFFRLDGDVIVEVMD